MCVRTHTAYTVHAVSLQLGCVLLARQQLYIAIRAMLYRSFLTLAVTGFGSAQGELVGWDAYVQGTRKMRGGREIETSEGREWS